MKKNQLLKAQLWWKPLDIVVVVWVNAWVRACMCFFFSQRCDFRPKSMNWVPGLYLLLSVLAQTKQCTILRHVWRRQREHAHLKLVFIAFDWFANECFKDFKQKTSNYQKKKEKKNLLFWIKLVSIENQSGPQWKSTQSVMRQDLSYAQPT